MATRSTDLKINILGDYDSLRKTVSKSIGEVDKLDKKTRQAGKGAGFKNMGKAALGAAAGIGAVAVAANEVKKSVTGTVELAKATRQLQRATGLASEDASRLAAVLKVRGLDTNKVGRSFTTLARQIEAAKKGTGGAADAFRQLGVSQKALQSGNFNQVLLGISDGYKKLGDSTAKASLGQQLFGRNSRDLLPLLEGGSKKLKEQLALAPQLSKAQVKQALAMVNAQRQVDLALMNVRVTLGTTLLPILADGANKLAKFVTEMKTGKGAGGEFAEKVKNIWNAAKPAVEQLVKFGKAVFNFAAKNPQVVKIAASLAAVGLAIKAIKFTSSITGLTTFINTAKALGGPLKKLFSKFGARAGGAFAAEASGSMAGNMAGSLAPSGTMGKLAGKGGKFAKWGRLAGRAAGIAFAAAMIFVIYEEVKALWKSNLINPENISKNQDLRPGTKKFDEARRFGQGGRGTRGRGVRGRGGARGSSVNMAPRGGGRGRGMVARGSSMGLGSPALRRRVAQMRPSLNLKSYGIRDFGTDPLTGGVPIEVLLARSTARATRAQNAADRFQNGIGSSQSKAETARLRELTRQAKLAQAEVDKLQKKLNRRDALLEIRSQFKDYTQSFTDAYAQGLQNIADARLNTAQTIAQKTLDAQLKALDEEQGSSEEAQRIRELRAQQETEAKTREDEDYAKAKLAIETDLARAIRNGNLRGQQELQGQLDDLEQQRRDTLRNREIQDLSESLQRQRNAAQSEYESKVTAAQDYYDKQVELNAKAVDDYKKVIEEQMAALTGQLEAGKISYTDFNNQVNALNGWLTAMFKGDLDNRAAAEITSLSDSLGRVGTYVGNVNSEFRRIMSTMPVPAIPPIPTITVDAVLNIQNLDQIRSILGGSGGSGGGGGNRTSDTVGLSYVRNLLRSAPRGGNIGVSTIASALGWTEAEVRQLLSQSEFAKIIRSRRLKARASGGQLSRSGLTMVGETGPELVMNGQVYSATRTARMSGAGVTLNVYPRTTADDPVALARALGWQLATR